MKDKYLILGISSLYPKQYDENKWKNRELDYFLSIKSLFNLNLDLDLHIFDNTVKELGEIRYVPLKRLLIDKIENFPAVIPKVFGYPEIFSSNYDIGYFNLLLKTKNLENLIKNYRYVTIINLRRYFLSQLWFNISDNFFSKKSNDILLIRNKSFNLKTMKLVEPKNPCEIQDFIFSMSPTCFQDYLKYISNITLKPPQESQNVLFDFSNLKKSMIVENVGIMRNEWNVLKQSFSFNNLIYT